MELAERAKAIILRPKETWEIIKGEEATVKGLYTSYAGILAMIPPVASFIGLSIVGTSVPLIGTWRQPVMSGVSHAVLYYVLSLVGILVTASIANLLASSFGSRHDMTAAMKAVVFSSTPAWVAGVFNIIHALGAIAWIAGLYSIYLLFLGLPLMMEIPAEKKTPYVAIVVVFAMLVMATISVITGLFVAGARAEGMVPRL